MDLDEGNFCQASAEVRYCKWFHHPPKLPIVEVLSTQHLFQCLIRLLCEERGLVAQSRQQVAMSVKFLQHLDGDLVAGRG